jgi:hypothetical protein
LPTSPYGRRPARSGGALPAPLRWLLGLNPLQSWLVVMAIVVGLSLLNLRVLALVVAIAWSAYALFTWFSPSLRRRLAQLRRNRF